MISRWPDRPARRGGGREAPARVSAFADSRAKMIG